MQDQPDVSVIVLGYNGQEYIDACLTSVLDQDFERPYEVLLVDNGSRDETASRAEKHSGVAVHRLGKNYGFCEGNNKGAALARAPVIVFLNQDVLVHRSWLRELVAAVEDDPTILVGHANVIHPWNREFAGKEREAPVNAAYTGELSRLGFVQYREVDISKPAVDTLFLSGVSIVLKRSAIERIGGYIFDPDMFLYGEDMDLGLRVRLAGYRNVVATRAVVYHSHTLDDRISLRSFLKTVRIIRNRLLALWKCSDWPQFCALAAVTLFGAPFNSSQFGLPAYKKALYFVLLIPPTALAGVAAFVAMPNYAVRRRQILATRRVGPNWLLRTLLFDRAGLSRSAAEPLPTTSRPTLAK
jgi:GT2 family glycosyltransferase